MKTLRSKKRRTILLLAGIYACSVLVRFFMATLTSNFPTVYVDEFLYYNLGRSIATEGALLYHGQPALYNYVVYPLMLAPVYKLFPAGTHFYRVIQFWNFCVMCLSVFPLYGLCRRMLKDEEKALKLSALFMLLPDFILGQFVLSEALIYPLFFTAVLLIYRSVQDGLTLRDGIALGALGGVLYQTKPGDVALPALAIVFFLIRSIKQKDKKSLSSALAGVASLGAVYLLFRLIADQVLAYSGSFFSIYDHQMNDYNGLFYDTFLRSLLLYPFYFILSCGVLPVLWGMARFSSLQKKDRHFYLLMLASMVIMIAGIAWMINRPEKSDILYLRYIAMYMPLVLLACLLPARADSAPAADSKPSWKMLLALTAIAVYTAACAVIYGSRAGATSYLHAPFLLSMSMVLIRNTPGIAGIVFVCACALSLFLALRRGDQKKMAALCCCVFLAVTFTNNCTGYYIEQLNTVKERGDEAMAVQRELKGEPYVYVYADVVCDMGMDVNTNQNISHVALYDFFNNIRENSGAYKPFVPEAEKGMVANRTMPDPGLIILDEFVHPLIKFSDATRCTSSSLGNLLMVRYTPGSRIVDSIIGNVENLTLTNYSTGILIIFNKEWLSGPIKLSMTIESDQEQTLSMFNAGSFKVPLLPGKNNYEITIQHPEFAYNFTVDKANIQIHRYSIAPAE